MNRGRKTEKFIRPQEDTTLTSVKIFPTIGSRIPESQLTPEENADLTNIEQLREELRQFLTQIQAILDLWNEVKSLEQQQTTAVGTELALKLMEPLQAKRRELNEKIQEINPKTTIEQMQTKYAGWISTKLSDAHPNVYLMQMILESGTDYHLSTTLREKLEHLTIRVKNLQDTLTNLHNIIFYFKRGRHLAK
jgi:Asp-tRNA(Asn)/Glu-tRNA(Gln) amidotransferase C subunit